MQSNRSMGALAFVAILVAMGAAARADDYAQWRGSRRAGISQETGLLKQWPAAGPRLAWQVKDAGYGFGAPAVVGKRVYLVSSTGLESESVVALDSATGAPVWKSQFGKVGNPQQQPNYPGARSTPTVVGSQLFALSSDGDLACLSTADGKVAWQVSLRATYGGVPGNWAYSESPLVLGDLVVAMPGGPQATVVALKRADGSLAWKCAVPAGDAAGYASAVAADVAGTNTILCYLAKGLVGIDARDGKLLWRYDGSAGMVNSMTPVVADGLVFTAAGRKGGGAVKVTQAAGAYQVEQAYFSRAVPDALGGAIALGGCLYGTNNAGLMCLDLATGTPKWQAPAVGSASLCCADGRLYLHGESGDVALVEATPAAYHELGRFTPADQPERKGTKAWAYPVVANGRLYIRDMGTLWCYDVSAR